jgi:hypothetical protein
MDDDQISGPQCAPSYREWVLNRIPEKKIGGAAVTPNLIAAQVAPPDQPHDREQTEIDGHVFSARLVGTTDCQD